MTTPDQDIPKPNEPLQVGQRIHCILYGGKSGVIYAIHGEQKPSTSREILGGIGVTGGNADFDIAWSRGSKSLRIPESLARTSVQWRLLPGVANTKQIKELLDAADKFSMDEEAQRIEASRVFEIEKARLITENPNLKVVDPGVWSGAKFCAANLRIELKKAFPGVKFSVTSQDSLSVRWTDGPTAKSVEKFSNKYKEGSFDGMEDIYKYDKSPWNSAFGGTEYVFDSRELSDAALDQAVEHLYLALPKNMEEVERKSGREMLCGGVINIPGINIDVREAINALCNAWDFVNGGFVDPDKCYYYKKWLIEAAISGIDEQKKSESAPAPVM